ncbi:permease [Rhodospirillum rubrum]|uniref:DUF6803 family protein n=1 Tax=Rhodospirillum rubrum TaxID=1085 RepID=UPI0019040D90|nr:DUF6803 family protein [Rhodospirillum rubrum]MBK1665617.1 permease [Rhodospirillum rubrum]MBK1677462.1 permease [Rhodospirillum rubrum]
MSMTHYMELLATNQPWNLLLFMAIPVILAETIAVTELYLLYTRRYDGWVRQINRLAGMVVGVYFTGVFFYLLASAVLPLTTSGGWRGWIDAVAVGFYLLGIVPLGGIALLEFKVIGGRRDEHGRMMIHAALVGLFLIVAHIAMIFGMLDPTLGGAWQAPDMPMEMPMDHGDTGHGTAH